MRKVSSLHKMKLDVPPEDEVLVEGMLGPMVILHREGRSMFMILSFDVVNGPWAAGIGGDWSFPAFWANAVQFMAGGAGLGVEEAYDPGFTPRIPRANLQQNDVNLKQNRLNGPVGAEERRGGEEGR